MVRGPRAPTGPARRPSGARHVEYAAHMSSRPGSEGPNPRLILAFLALIVAAQGFYAALSVFVDTPIAPGPLQVVVGAAFAVYAVLIVVFAFGLWQRQPWAWMVAVIATIMGLVVAGLEIAAGDRLEDHLFGMAIDAILLYYLNKQSIKDLFAA